MYREIELDLARSEGPNLSILVQYAVTMERSVYGADADGNRGEMRTEFDYVGPIKMYDGKHKEIKIETLEFDDIEKIYKAVHEDLDKVTEEDFYQE